MFLDEIFDQKIHATGKWQNFNRVQKFAISA